MNNLNRSRNYPQFRCLPMTGGPSQQPFRYSLNLPDSHYVVNHSFVEWAVGEHLHKLRKSGG